MMLYKDPKQLKPLVGKEVYAMTRQGQMIYGVLDKMDNEKIYLRVKQPNVKQVQTNAFGFGGFGFNPIAPLVLFDLLAIGTSPFGFGFGGFPFFV